MGKGLARMSQDNQITLRGYLTSEPKFHQTALTGTPVTEIRLGSTPRRLNRETGEWQDQPTSYYKVKCWRRLAINASSSLKKGDMVIVRGHFYTRTWLDNQQRQRTELEVEADSLGHDLTFGWSHFLRGSRPIPGAPAAVNAGELARQNLGDQNSDDSVESDGEFPPGDDREELAGAAFASGGQADPDDPGYPDPDDPGHSDGTADELAAAFGTPAPNGADGVPEAADALERVMSAARSDAAVPGAESMPL
jgi:single-strand DNA-binding protein